MEDSVENSSEDSEESLLLKHKAERKELQARIQQLKHAVPKGDKKRKKELQVQVAQMEAELDEKQENELKQMKEKDAQNVTAVCDGVERVCVDGAAGEMAPALSEIKKKKSKAQKRREKKEMADKERDARIKEQEVENLSGARHVESQKLKSTLKSRGLALHEIPSDGNCLYAAVAHQLELQSQKTTVDDLRKQTADHMRANKDDFLPFLCKPDSGDPYTEDEFLEYCTELESTPAWGGQLEIRALSAVLRRPMEVLQADAPPVVSGEELRGGATVVLPYFRHAFGLGEHYNSVRPATAADEDDDSDR